MQLHMLLPLLLVVVVCAAATAGHEDGASACAGHGDCLPGHEARSGRRHADAAPAAPACAKMPDARPPPSERLLVSATVEKTIADLAPRFKSAALATLFANCLPNTLDTTVRRWTYAAADDADAFVVTGDIEAMWLRDSTNQVLPYVAMVRGGGHDDDLALVGLLEGVIRRQARSVLIDPYANAFTLLATDVSPHAADSTSYPGFAGTRHRGMRRGVFERKYELDSLANVLLLAARYYEATKSLRPFDQTWQDAAASVLAVMHEQRDAVVSRDAPAAAAYAFQRAALNPTDTLSHGDTWPNRATGLVRSAFRPSDDATALPYNVPANALAAVALRAVAPLLAALGRAPLAADCLQLADGVEKAIHTHAVVEHPATGRAVLAYELDGFGNHLFMDDANLPSLLALPVFGFLNASDPLYLSTRDVVLSADTNPYFFSGLAGRGVGGPHNGVNFVWPMSVMVQAWTARSDAEVETCLEMLVNSSACTGLMHESFHADSVHEYTRPWFAWANSLFGDLVLKVARERPHLILKD